MKSELRELTAQAIAEIFNVQVEPEFVRTEAAHGDFTSNVAMRLAASLDKPPHEIAQAIAEKLNDKGIKTEIAGPGFINVTLSDSEIWQAALAAADLPQVLKGKEVVAEYSDPNAFKVLHGGHLYTSLVGDAIANIVENAGANVHRVNFGGDVGLHVAKCMWSILKELGAEDSSKLTDIPDDSKLEWVSAHYVEGNTAYEDDEAAKAEITTLNMRVYQIHKENDQASEFAKIYWTCRQWSYDGFEVLYQKLNMKPFDKYYPESSVFEIGLNTVKEHIGDVYEISDGAVIYKGEKHGLFTQVFINSEGLPTYAGKDVGLIQQKYNDYKFDISFMITDVSQKDHIAVVLKSIEEFAPDLAQKTVHYTHGRVKLAGGQKMSSRKGNILRAEDILESAFEASQKAGNNDPEVVLGAVRYSFLRNRVGGDIVYHPEESVSLEGNSGPYLQYALVRARSILRKLEESTEATQPGELDEHERSLARQISIYPEAFELALAEYSPHHLCNYLYELAVVFNRFYENSRVVGHKRAGLRSQLVRAYEKTLAHGLSILGMPQPEKM